MGIEQEPLWKWALLAESAAYVKHFSPCFAKWHDKHQLQALL